MKLLMVCLGNICRSPMADGLMRKIADERGLNIIVDSAGTSDYHIGEAPDERMQKTALAKGVDISFLQARQFHPEDFETYDLIFAMDLSNKENILELASGDHHTEKVRLILNELHPNENMEVPDPYFGGDAGFDDVYQLLHDACNKIADKIKHGEYR